MTATTPARLAARATRSLGAPVRPLWLALRWPARLAALAVLGLVLVALLGDVLAPYDPTRNLVGPAAAPPSGEHWLGTDLYGRDVLSRVISGARVSVVAGVLTPLLALLAGALVGAAAAVVPGPARRVLEWLLDLLVTFPGIVLAVALLTLLRPGLTATVLVLSVTFAPAVARVVRAAVLAELGKDYVLVEEFTGASLWWLVSRHVARNVAGPVVVFASSLAAAAVINEAVLSFLGLGVPPPTASWGMIINEGQDLLASGGWWVSAAGGVATLLAVLALSVLSDGLAGALQATPVRAGELRDLAAAAGAAAPAPVAGTAGPAPTGPTGTGRTGPDPAAAPGRAPAGVAAATAAPPPDRAWADPADPVLEVRDLTVRFGAAEPVVHGVSFAIGAGESVGLVGESGSGKSLTTLAVNGLLPPGATVTGSVRFRGEELIGRPARDRRRLLGTGIATVYQDALTALNPGMRVSPRLARVCGRGGRHTPADLLDLVHLDPARTLRAYPHQLSGGQRQRVLIAMALAGDPALLLADEPTTALDVTLQAEIGELLAELVAGRGLALLLVSHDLAFVAGLTSRIGVMRAGRLVEAGPTWRVLTAPAHPYTAELTGAIAALERGRPALEPEGAAR
jgi:peptide/nickel transport system permease protein